MSVTEPQSLITEWANEDHIGIDIIIHCENLGKLPRRNAIAVEIGITKHDDKVFISFLFDNRLHCMLRSFQRVVTTQTELCVCLQRLSPTVMYTHSSKLKTGAQEAGATTAMFK